jgi:flagellum-specific peptidoglycan hydrolase FlgJ
MNPLQRQFLDRATAEAMKVQHPFPQMAACEAALESGWGASVLAREGNNLFGMKQHQHPNPACGVMALPTREFLNSEWVTCESEWVKYPDWASCFADRLSTLKRLSTLYSHYAAALAATDAQTYITEVSQTWSTDPDRAKKVLSIYQDFSSQRIQ